MKGKLSPLSKVAFSAKVSEEISETDIDEWHETPDVKWALWNMCFKLPQKGKRRDYVWPQFSDKRSTTLNAGTHNVTEEVGSNSLGNWSTF